MCARLLACPLCCQPSFSTLDALRAGLVSVATRPLMCPVCNEVLLGIDKLTIHLFSHTINLNDDAPKPISSVTNNNNQMSSQYVQNKDLHNWDQLNKQITEINKLQNRKNSTENHYLECTKNYNNVANHKSKSSQFTSPNQIQNLSTLTNNPQILLLSRQTCQNTNMDIYQHCTGTETPMLNSHNNSSESALKTNYSEQCYSNDKMESLSIQQNSSQSEEINAQHVWIKDLSGQSLNDCSLSKSELSSNISKTQHIVLKEIEANAKQQSSQNNSVILFPHIIPLSRSIVVQQNNSEQYLNTTSPSDIKTKELNADCMKVQPHIETVEILTEERNERCNVCGFHFPDHNILVLHKQLVHMIDEKNMNSKPEELLQTYSCHLCSKVFKMRGSLMVHMRVAHIGYNLGSLSKDGDTVLTKGDDGYNCPTCGKKFRKEQHVIQHLKTHEGKQWECDVCSKMFTTKYFLKKHKRLHSGEMPYKCNICDKTFTFQQSYHKHRLYHKDDKPHTCSTCGRSFKELSTLHNHERIHTGEKPFACETCGKCFRQRVSYLVHRRIHTGAMPYTCSLCGKNFRYKVSQRTHKCPAQQGASRQQVSEGAQKPTMSLDLQEKSDDSNNLRKTSPQQEEQILNISNNVEQNKFVLIIDAQGQHVLTRESDLEQSSTTTKEQEILFTEAKEPNKNLNSGIWNTKAPTTIHLKESIETPNNVLPEYTKNNTEEATDFFSMVMSPLENGLTSPTTEMEHLRVSSPVPKDASLQSCNNFRHITENIGTDIIHNSIEETYTSDHNNRNSLETINEESLKQLLYGIDGK